MNANDLAELRRLEAAAKELPPHNELQIARWRSQREHSFRNALRNHATALIAAAERCERLETELAEANDGLVEFDADRLRLFNRGEEAEQRAELLAAENAGLRDALQELVDWQNGPPLIAWTEQWQAAMDRAAKALAKENA